ncbi:MAG: SRPBCC domain-containing protein [Bacteroidota bacterium]
MKSEKIELTEIIHCTAKKLYNAWLTTEEHAAFTGAKAKISNKPGGKFMASDGYIRGENIELENEKRILQSWRTSDFPENADDSLLEVIFEDVKQGCKLTIIHWNIPEGQHKMYADSWNEYYLKPMKEYYDKMH